MEGNGQRPTHKGDGYSESDVSYTLNHVEQHGVAYGIDQQGGKSGANYTDDVAPTLCSDSHGTPHGVCFNSWDIQSKHIQPMDGTAETLYSGECRYGGGESYVLALEPGAASRVGGHIYEDGASGSLRAEAGDNQMSVCYGVDVYNQTVDGDIASTVTTVVGVSNTSGPKVVEEKAYGVDVRNSKLNEDVNGTLQSKSNGGWNANSNGVVCYGIGSYGSNAWKSSNPHSGVYEAETARTLDNVSCGSPTCNQGGVAIVEQR